MNIEFTLDIIEQKKDRLFVIGIPLSEIALNATFTSLYQYTSSKKSQKQLAQIDLSVEAIIVDGEPAEIVNVNTVAMLVLAGDSRPIVQEAEALQWRKKSGRLIRTSETALTLAAD